MKVEIAKAESIRVIQEEVKIIGDFRKKLELIISADSTQSAQASHRDSLILAEIARIDTCIDKHFAHVNKQLSDLQR